MSNFHYFRYEFAIKWLLFMFCLCKSVASPQVDFVLDISRPAYGQLQKLKGTDCANDEVSAATQATQRPWETKPTRMLLLQVRHVREVK